MSYPDHGAPVSAALPPHPLAIVAELTHRCPLHCVYCSNPAELVSRQYELSTADWLTVIQQAAEIGVLQIDFTGGEPLARQDLNDLIAAARGAGLYSNLITSGIGLDERRLDALLGAGLEHLQLSFQDVCEESADEFAGARAHARKLSLARQIRTRPVAFTMNVVVHRGNLDRLDEILFLAEDLGAHRLEIAHVQYYGWAFENRVSLIPTREQVERSLELVRAAQERLGGRMRIEFVTPDYYGRFPKACTGGWGRKLMLVTPSGDAWPCHAAGVIPGLEFDNVRQRSLGWIWKQSPAFNAFRGEAWMQEPCRSCERRSQDFGGCRCQAAMLAGDSAATDPVCSLAPSHHLVAAVVASANAAQAGLPDVTGARELRGVASTRGTAGAAINATGARDLRAGVEGSRAAAGAITDATGVRDSITGGRITSSTDPTLVRPAWLYRENPA